MNKKVVSHKQLLAEKNTFVAGLANDLPCVLSMIACTLSIPHGMQYPHYVYPNKPQLF